MGGGCRGVPHVGPPQSSIPRDVLHKGVPVEEQVTIINGRLLYELIAWWKPDLIEAQVEWLSPQEAWIYLLEPDNTLLIRRATLSLDGRWTLSPVY
jgi:hypothetical protein